MGKPVKIVGIILIGLLVLAQFFQPERNLGATESAGDLLRIVQIPDTLAVLLKSSCYDCHSNHTDYPWYSYISPVSWYLNKHIEDGKEEMNLSDYGSLDKKQKIKTLSDICEEIESGEMPLKSYRFIHREAAEIINHADAICNWSEQAALTIMKE